MVLFVCLSLANEVVTLLVSEDLENQIEAI